MGGVLGGIEFSGNLLINGLLRSPHIPTIIADSGWLEPWKRQIDMHTPVLTLQELKVVISVPYFDIFQNPAVIIYQHFSNDHIENFAV